MNITLSDALALYVSQLTEEPGVYKMFDKNDTLLYVGKAQALKKRVSSYFKNKNSGAKTLSLVGQIAKI
jgi:excinuclease ABC subunit C